ncbi:MAG: hypothetical protein JSR98_17280 [Proteobacteria bacterium]|nr:hypothetical protein [Pseudomonadota bacterium]
MIVAALTAAALMMQAAPASSPAPAGIPGTRSVSPLTVTPTPQEKAQVAQKKLICSDEQVLGTLFPKRMCGTAEEIEDHKRESQEYLRKAQAFRPYDANSGLPQ